MKRLKLLIVLSVTILCFSLAYAAGDAASGMKLFKDPTFAGSTNKRACQSCHPGGEGLENAAAKDWSENKGPKSLEDMINVCITNPLQGKALAKDSEEMMDLVAYIKSLAK